MNHWQMVEGFGTERKYAACQTAPVAGTHFQLVDDQHAITCPACIEWVSGKMIVARFTTEADTWQWAEFGRAVADAVRDKYAVDLVCTRDVPPDNPALAWRPSALRLWHAAKTVGLRR